MMSQRAYVLVLDTLFWTIYRWLVKKRHMYVKNLIWLDLILSEKIWKLTKIYFFTTVKKPYLAEFQPK